MLEPEQPVLAVEDLGRQPTRMFTVVRKKMDTWTVEALDDLPST
jgi:hypothetical protein